MKMKPLMSLRGQPTSFAVKKSLKKDSLIKGVFFLRITIEFASLRELGVFIMRKSQFHYNV